MTDPWVAWLAPGGDGLPWSRLTPVLGVALAAAWLLSARLVTAGRDWRRLPATLFGWTWLGFGIAFVMRFWVVSVDALTYADPGGRLLRVPPATVDRALVLAGAYWLCVCLAYAVMRAPKLNPLGLLSGAFTAPSPVALDAVSVVATVAIVASSVAPVPDGLLRPLGLVASAWAIAAAAAWGATLRREVPARLLGLRRWLYLAPGLLAFYFQPYREGLLAVAVVPLLAALFAGRRLRLGRTLALFVAFGVASTVVVSAYRLVAWEGWAPADATRNLDPYVWRADPSVTPWAALLRRFHAFDSLLIYVDLVPDFVPFERRNPLGDVVVEAFLPRALYPTKPDSARARVFARELWTFGMEEGFEANIAPSMAGDLYGSGGARWVMVGALVWGAVLSLLDRWAARLTPTAWLVLVTSLGLLAAGGIERDFARATATLVQSAAGLVAVALVVPRWTGRAPGPLPFPTLASRVALGRRGAPPA